MPGYELIGNEEFSEIEDVFANGAVLFRRGFENIRNDCFKVDQFEKTFAAKMNCEYSLAVTSGTSALRVALAALDVGEGDEVITQCFTFVATVEAIIEAKAKPICTEIDRTLNMDPHSLEKLITPKTKAVIVVHMLGSPANIEIIRDICKNKNVFLIEDTAWGCGGNVNNVPLGTWGDIGTYSFDYAKTITTGEGGMLVFKEKDHFLKACAWHDHGHENNPDYPRWEDTRSSSGFNFRMMELQGAIGIAQLKKLNKIVSMQRDNFKRLETQLLNLKNIYPRELPLNSYGTADALVFLVNNKNLAISCRKSLLRSGISTKILPEAITWHFAGTWTHMKELNINQDNCFQKSRELLDRAVSIPITVKKFNEEYINLIVNVISKVVS